MKKIRYPLTSYSKQRLAAWHYHGNAEDPARFKLINDATRELAEMIFSMCPPSRNQSLAITNLEAVRMRANASIAVDEGAYNYGSMVASEKKEESTSEKEKNDFGI